MLHCCCLKSKINQRFVLFIHSRALQVISYTIHSVHYCCYYCCCIGSRLVFVSLQAQKLLQARSSNVCEGKSISPARRACGWPRVEKSKGNFVRPQLVCWVEERSREMTRQQAKSSRLEAGWRREIDWEQAAKGWWHTVAGTRSCKEKQCRAVMCGQPCHLAGQGWDSAVVGTRGRQVAAFPGGLCGIPRTRQGQGSQSAASTECAWHSALAGSWEVAVVSQQTLLLIPCNLGQLLALKQLKFWLSEIEPWSFSPQKLILKLRMQYVCCWPEHMLQPDSNRIVTQHHFTNKCAA